MRTLTPSYTLPLVVSRGFSGRRLLGFLKRDGGGFSATGLLGICFFYRIFSCRLTDVEKRACLKSVERFRSAEPETVESFPDVGVRGVCVFRGGEVLRLLCLYE